MSGISLDSIRQELQELDHRLDQLIADVTNFNRENPNCLRKNSASISAPPDAVAKIAGFFSTKMGEFSRKAGEIQQKTIQIAEYLHEITGEEKTVEKLKEIKLEADLEVAEQDQELIQRCTKQISGDITLKIQALFLALSGPVNSQSV